MLPVSKISKSRAASPARRRLDIAALEHDASVSASCNAPTVVAVRGDSTRVGASDERKESIAGPQTIANIEEPLPDLTDLENEPEASPSQVVRKITRKNRDILLVRSDTESEAASVTGPKGAKNGPSTREPKTTAKTPGTRRPLNH